MKVGNIPSALQSLLEQCKSYFPRTSTKTRDIEVSAVIATQNGDQNAITVIKDSRGHLWALPVSAGTPKWEDLKPGMRLRITVKRTLFYTIRAIERRESDPPASLTPAEVRKAA